VPSSTPRVCGRWVVILPGLMFGKVLGLMTLNLIALCTPSLRQVLEHEEADRTSGFCESDGRSGEIGCRACNGNSTWVVVFPTRQMKVQTPNQPDAVNPARAPRFQVGLEWREVTDPRR
jgi:hypothetical protein